MLRQAAARMLQQATATGDFGGNSVSDGYRPSNMVTPTPTVAPTTPPKIVRSMEYFNTFKTNNDLELAKSNLSMELKRRATDDEAVEQADLQDKEGMAMRRHFREKWFEPAFLLKAQEVHELELYGRKVMTKREVFESIDDMLWRNNDNESKTQKALSIVYDMKYGWDESFYVGAKDSWNSYKNVQEVGCDGARKKRKSNIVGIAKRVFVESFHRPLDHVLLDPSTRNGEDKEKRGFKVLQSNPKRDLSRVTDKKDTRARKPKKFDPEVHVRRVENGGNSLALVAVAATQKCDAVNSLREALARRKVTLHEIKDVLRDYMKGIQGDHGGDNSSVSSDDFSQFSELFAGGDQGDGHGHLMSLDAELAEAIEQQHGQSDTEESDRANADNEDDSNESATNPEPDTNAVYNDISAPKPSPKTSIPGASKTRTSTPCDTAKHSYCKCKNPVMTDLLYETESTCESTAYYMKNNRDFVGRVCFDCKEHLSSKFINKKVLFHWCKNSILEDDNGKYICDFIVCPDCHKKRMDKMYGDNSADDDAVANSLSPVGARRGVKRSLRALHH